MDMQEIGTVQMHAPSAIKLREKYERNINRRKRLKATFDELVDMFIRRGMSNEAVARIYGMAIEPVRLCRKRYVDPLLEQTAHEQYTSRRRKHRSDNLRELPTRNPLLAPVAHAAEEAGLTVHRVYSRGAPSCRRQTALRINGHLCSVHLLTSRDRRSSADRQKYVGFCFRRETWAKPAVRIFVVPIGKGKNRIFIVPAFYFNRRRTKAPLVSGHVLLEPRKRVMYIPGQIDWAKCEDAWRFLEGE